MKRQEKGMTRSFSVRMLLRASLLAALLLSSFLFVATQGAAASDTSVSPPSCVEDGHVYSIEVGDITFGAISGARVEDGDGTGGSHMCAEGDASLVVLQEPAPPSLLYLNQGWNYIFGAYVAAGSTRAGQLNFTLHARCSGNVVCKATIFYQVSGLVDGGSTTSTIDSHEDSGGDDGGRQPHCTTAAVTRVYSLGVLYSDTFPHDIEDVTCRYATRITQPSVGAAAVLMPRYPLRYVFTAPVADAVTDKDMSTFLQYTILCNDSIICHDKLAITLRATVLQCPIYEQVFEVMPEALRRDTLRLGTTCPSAQDELTVRVLRESVTAADGSGAAGQLVFAPTGSAFQYLAPATEMNDVYTVRSYCGAEPLCDAMVAFLVSHDAHTPGPTGGSASSTADNNGDSSSMSASSHKPHTIAPATGSSSSTGQHDGQDSGESVTPLVTTCAEGRNYTVPVGRVLRGTLHIPLDGICDLVTYRTATDSATAGGRAETGLMGSFEVNLIGDFVYHAPSTQEAVDVAEVDVYCVNRLVCRAAVVLIAYQDLSPDSHGESQASESGTTRSPMPQCPNVYFYETTPGMALSGSLRGVRGESPCAYGRYFTLVSSVQEGTLTLTAAGDFLYIPTQSEGQYDFAFDMYCLNALTCRGSAYIFVSQHLTPPPSPDSATDETDSSGTPANVTNPQIRCRGTCSAKAWKTYPDLPLWDNSEGRGYARKDGLPLDGLQVTWRDNALLFELFTLIGNLGVRFPTFEPLHSAQSHFFEPADFAATLAPSSPGFEMSCLRQQSREGRGEDVWRWTSLGDEGTGEGGVGPLYAQGNSWYQKFGGKHIQCDTFVDACRYAPLLTPASNGDATAAETASPGGPRGRWTIEIDDCDATWRGVFSFAALMQLRRGDGRPVWSFVAPHQLRGTLLSQAVRPHSWLVPGRFDAQYNSHDIAVDLQQFVVVRKVSDLEPRFSVDAEFFTFRTDAGNVRAAPQLGGGDYGFGVNMLVYPFVTPEMKQSYAVDRHVVGFKWLRQRWTSPGDAQCAHCTGRKMQCNSPSEPALSAYTGPFPDGDCPEGAGRVRLIKGPAMALDSCPANEMHVYNQPGFSAPRNCRHTYQNITFRGVVPGSATLTEEELHRFYYEGDLRLQLLMGDGSKELVDFRLSLYVSRLAQDDAPVTHGGELRLCRSGSYWPVLDPLGLSLPDRPFPLSVNDAAALCVDDLSSSFGPSDWTLFTLVMPDVAATQVVVRSIYVAYEDERVYLHYRNPATGLAATPPREVGQWWRQTHPFFAFRDLAGRALNQSLSTTNDIQLHDVVYAFAFIPGAINRDCNLEVVLEASVVVGERASVSTFRRMLNIDPQLTQLSRQGPPKESGRPTRPDSRSDLYALGATAGITVVIIITAIFFMLADNRRPLPKWVPRGKLIKETVLSVLPPGLRVKRKEKRVLHRDMYAAMNSGKY